jgi:hypothetical protein
MRINGFGDRQLAPETRLIERHRFRQFPSNSRNGEMFSIDYPAQGIIADAADCRKDWTTRSVIAASV